MDTGIDVVKEQSVSLYPVSVEWRPPFSMLVPLKVWLISGLPGSALWQDCHIAILCTWLLSLAPASHMSSQRANLGT